MGLLQEEDGCLYLPAASQWKVLKTLHQTFHLRKDKTLQMAQKLFTGKGLQKTIKDILTSCEVCHKNNPLKHPQTPIAVQRQGKWPGKDWQLDFTHRPKAKGYTYLLVWMDTFTHWVEAFSCRTEKAIEVVKILIIEITTRFAPPPQVSSKRQWAFFQIFSHRGCIQSTGNRLSPPLCLEATILREGRKDQWHYQKTS